MTLNLARLFFEAVGSPPPTVRPWSAATVRSPSGKADYRWAKRVLAEKTPSA